MSETFESKAGTNMPYWGTFMDEILNFSITSHPRPSVTTLDNIVYQPKLAIYSGNKKWLEEISERVVNGHVWNINNLLSSIRGNQYRHWGLVTGNSVECFKFLQWIKPFLSFKQAQAEIFEDFLNQKREVRKYTQNLSKVSPMYFDPYERMEVEAELQQKLVQAKRQVTPESAIPSQERLAGIIDAGMSLGLFQAERDNYIEFLARGTLISIRHGLLEALYKRYGGTKPYKSSDATVTKVQIPSYEWQINGPSLGKLLADVEPNLLFKKAQARFILEFLRVRQAVMSTRKFAGDQLINAQRSKIMQSFLDEWPNIDPLPR